MENRHVARQAEGWDGTSIRIDVCIRADDEDRHDLHGHLIGELRAEKGVPHLDDVILTHPNQARWRKTGRSLLSFWRDASSCKN